MKMKVFMDNDLKLDGDRNVFGIGAFDGFHRGHQKLVELLNNYQREGYKAGIISFFPHPDVILKRVKYQPLFPPEERIKQVEEMGLDLFIIIKFTYSIAKMGAEEFAEQWLRKKFNAKIIVIGENFTFGYEGKGDRKTLENLGKKLGFEVKTVPLLKFNGFPISSSRIRKAINDGDMEKVASLLGKPYYLRGKVIKGEGIGKKMGFPTANIFTIWKMLPPDGVYAVICEINNKRKVGALHIGPRVTFGKTKRAIEVHIIGFDGDIYGKEIKVSFIKRIRGTIKFKNIKELQSRIREDIKEIALITSSFL